MTRRNLLITGFVAVVSSAIWAQNPLWTPKLSVPKDAWLPGEPISATLILTNNSGSSQPFSWHGQFYLDGVNKPCVDRNAPAVTNPVPDTRAPGAKPPVPLSLEPPGNTHQVNFPISRECNLVALDPKTVGRHRLCYRETRGGSQLQEACIEFSIVVPKGEDAQAMKLFAANLRDIGDDSTLAAKILKLYPTSTYAGYAVLHGGPWPIDPVGEVALRGKSLATAEKWPGTRAQMDKEEKDRRDLNQSRADQLAAYLKARPDFVYADFMKLELATRYAYLERYQDAQCLCEELVKRVPESEEAKKAQRLLAHLQEKGWVKK